ncbi:MAG: hypothetical protein IJ119_01370 [Clostridia bacterium]|nr:hypothetical protein [Clostridia bacterium]
MTATTKKSQFLNTDDLAKELGIDHAAADALMQRDTFPATVIDGKAYVVDRGLLESWIRHNAKRVDGINAGDLFADLAMTKNKWVNESFSAARKQHKSSAENGHYLEKSEALKRDGNPRNPRL